MREKIVLFEEEKKASPRSSEALSLQIFIGSIKAAGHLFSGHTHTTSQAWIEWMVA